MNVKLKDRFVGLSAAMVGNPETVSDRHCVWVAGERDVLPGGKGKRIHVPKRCPSCIAGRTAWDAPHPLAIHSPAGISAPLLSTPHNLPWETREVLENITKARYTEEMENDLL